MCTLSMLHSDRGFVVAAGSRHLCATQQWSRLTGRSSSTLKPQGRWPVRDRVFSIAVAIDENGTVGRKLVTLVNPGCDAGPVHIHELVSERLAGAPMFDDARRS